MATGQQWNEVKLLVLDRLERIDHNQIELNQKLDDIDTKLTKLDSMKHTVDELKKWREKRDEAISLSEVEEMKKWKARFDEIASPTQIADMKKDIEGLKTFKTVSTTAWIVVQIIFGIVITLIRLF